MDDILSKPHSVNEIIGRCLKLEQEHGPELPFEILTALSQKYPYNEEVAYLLVTMSDYDRNYVTQYLNTFAQIEKVVPFAEEFLDNTINLKYMASATQLESYIKNKLLAPKQRRYLEQLAELRATYLGRSTDPSATLTLYIYFIACTVVNVGVVVLLLLASLMFLLNLAIGVGIFLIEILILLLHNKKYGNRLDISNRERLFMVIFMCSLALVMGGVFIGSIW
jgi:uncharacterized short protein YbdD (DUF466 family)